MLNVDKIRKLRLDYLATCPPPVNRIGIYISREVGKGYCIKVLARSLVKVLHSESVNDIGIYYENKVLSIVFQNYDRQPFYLER